jgi:hypothetical protein
MINYDWLVDLYLLNEQEIFNWGKKHVYQAGQPAALSAGNRQD